MCLEGQITHSSPLIIPAQVLIQYTEPADCSSSGPTHLRILCLRLYVCRELGRLHDVHHHVLSRVRRAQSSPVTVINGHEGMPFQAGDIGNYRV